MEVSGRRNDRTETVKGVICQPCQSDGDVIEAEGYCETCNEFFCSSCLGFHRKQSMTRNHTIKIKNEMPIVGGQTDQCLEPCIVHNTEVVKFYCAEHDFVGCGDCMVLDHKTCNVVLVQTVSGEYKNGDDLKNLTRMLEQLKVEFVSCHQKVKQNLTATPELKRKAVDAVKQFREEMNDYLDTVEGDILTQLEQLESEDLTLQNQLMKDCASFEKEIDEFLSKLSTEPEKVNQLFVMANFAKKRMHFFQQSLEQITRQNEIKDYHFEPSKDFINCQQFHIPLGNIVTKEIQARNPSKQTFLISGSLQEEPSLFGRGQKEKPSHFGRAPPETSSLFGRCPPETQSLFGRNQPKKSSLFGRGQSETPNPFVRCPPETSRSFGICPPEKQSSFEIGQPEEQRCFRFGRYPPQTPSFFERSPPQSPSLFGRGSLQTQNPFERAPQQAPSLFGRGSPQTQNLFERGPQQPPNIFERWNSPQKPFRF